MNEPIINQSCLECGGEFLHIEGCSHEFDCWDAEIFHELDLVTIKETEK